MYGIEFDNGMYLEHHGVKGQKWGQRRYQNADGSLTAKGQKRQAKFEKWKDKNIEQTNKWSEKQTGKVKKIESKMQKLASDSMGIPGNKYYKLSKKASKLIVKNDIAKQKAKDITIDDRQKAKVARAVNMAVFALTPNNYLGVAAVAATSKATLSNRYADNSRVMTKNDAKKYNYSKRLEQTDKKLRTKYAVDRDQE